MKSNHCKATLTIPKEAIIEDGSFVILYSTALAL